MILVDLLIQCLLVSCLFFCQLWFSLDCLVFFFFLVDAEIGADHFGITLDRCGYVVRDDLALVPVVELAVLHARWARCFAAPAGQAQIDVFEIRRRDRRAGREVGRGGDGVQPHGRAVGAGAGASDPGDARGELAGAGSQDGA